MIPDRGTLPVFPDRALLHRHKDTAAGEGRLHPEGTASHGKSGFTPPDIFLNHIHHPVAQCPPVREQKKKPKAFHFAETTAYHLSVWYRDNRFCGRCGGRTEQDRTERMLRCPVCGNMIYPKIAPAVIVALTDGDRLLMTRYRGRPYKGYALIAGFNEVGETMEDTVRREIMEEVGLRCRDIRYCGSQPWGTESNLLLGYFAKLDGDAAIHLDRQELSEAEWLDREEIDIPADGYSLTNHMIQLFLRGQEP